MNAASGPNPDFAGLFEVFTEIGIIEHLSRTAGERVMPRGLSMAGFAVLNHMVRLGEAPRPPARIAAALQVTKGAMTGTLRRLEQEGLVIIAPDPGDGRAKLVSVTDRGRQARRSAIEALGPQFAFLLTRIDPAELTAMLPTLRRLRAILDQAREPSAF